MKVPFVVNLKKRVDPGRPGYDFFGEGPVNAASHNELRLFIGAEVDGAPRRRISEGFRGKP